MLVLLASASVDAGSLSVDNPFVLGPIAAFIFTVFVTEVVVSGKAYRREVEENSRLRALTERVVPLAENMVKATTESVTATQDVIRVMHQILDAMAREGFPLPRKLLT